MIQYPQDQTAVSTQMKNDFTSIVVSEMGPEMNDEEQKQNYIQTYR